MESKSLLFGLIGFFLGGLIVSIAASGQQMQTKSNEMTMTQMTDFLRGKNGDEYDKAFISAMINHHQGAIDMAKLSASRAKHEEIKQLSSSIITAQQNEIEEMKQWQVKWGYSPNPSSHTMHEMTR